MAAGSQAVAETSSLTNQQEAEGTWEGGGKGQGMVDFWKFKAGPQQHTSSNKAVPPKSFPKSSTNWETTNSNILAF